MARVHAKDTVVLLNGNDLSAFCNTSNFNRSGDEHDVTTYGKDDHVFDGGLGTGESTIGGFYDNTAAGPKAIIEPLINTVVTLIRRPEGTGSGLPQESVDVLVRSYNESSPVADWVTWEAQLRHSDAVTRTTQ